LFGDVTILGHYNHVAWHLFEQFHATPEIAADDMATIAAAHPDLLYFNYYNTETIRAAEPGSTLPFKKVINPFLDQTEFGWDLDPAGFRLTLRQLYDRYNLPMIITENGLGAHDTLTADGKVHDPYRIKYLNDHIYQMRLAIGEGIPVIGYHVWSAIDLVSTHEGFTKRYGFIYVDRGETNDSGTLKRYKKDSFDWYKDVIAHNGDNVTGPVKK
jgi:6-phospho-beta-glucosidase